MKTLIDPEYYQLWLEGNFKIDEVQRLRDEYLKMFKERFTDNNLPVPEQCQRLINTYNKIITENIHYETT